jgi:hypothetical protein
MRRTLLLLAGAALLLVLIWRLGPSEIAAALRAIGWSFLPVLALGTAPHLVRAEALRRCLVLGRRLRYVDALAIRLSGESVQSLTFTGPVLSQPTTAWLLEQQGLTLREAFAGTLTEYLAFSFVSASIAIAGLTYFVTQFSPARALVGFAVVVAALCAVFLLLSALAIFRRIYLLGAIIGWLARIGVLRGRLRPDMAWINALEDQLLVVLHDSPARFARILAIELAAQGCLVAELFWLMRALHIITPIVVPFVIDAALKGIDIAFLFVPMQMGVSEGGYALVFSTMGLSAATGLAVALVRRARGLIVAAIGLATLAALGGSRRRGVRL